ncbi:hypothetical protein [Halomonas sp. 328]|uniref:hypothetical protein n=1 Tax=Halomonas sp. 328 TaxID=2776704 RepID=UPI0018A70FBE|nr:hypothetical protein [Halomonas sp. 328]MBF8222826.1 hypothetical protein [Halomonas sp. 328]
MKIHIEFDLTPAEFRQALGLPDVEAYHQAVLERIKQQMEAGVEGYDPLSLLQPFLDNPLMPEAFKHAFQGQKGAAGQGSGWEQGLAGFGHYQQMLMEMLRKAASQAGSAAPHAEPPPESPAGNGPDPQGGGDKAPKGSASAASARRRQG